MRRLFSLCICMILSSGIHAFTINGYKEYKLNIPISSYEAKGLKCDYLGCVIEVNNTFGGAQVKRIEPYADNDDIVNRMVITFAVSSLVIKRILDHHFGKATHAFKEFKSDGSVDTRYLWVADNGASYYVYIQGAVDYQDDYWANSGTMQVLNKESTNGKIAYWKNDF